MTLSFTELSRYDRYAHALEYGHQGETRTMLHQAAELPETGNDSVTEWLAARLKLPLPNRNWPPVINAQSLGWQQYYQGNLPAAATTFTQAWQRIQNGEDHYGFRPDVALGLGKVYTRTGHWQAARDWLLLFLAEARRSDDLFAVTQGYGALGELFLRADQGKPALACLSTAFHILPPGSGQQSRQLNYLASALIRNREWLRAESLLMTGLQNARAMLAAGMDTQEATGSVWHALARLQFLELARHPDNPVEIPWQGQDGEKNPPPVAQGLLAAGRALCAWRRGDRATSITRLEEAERFLQPTLPMEHAWARRLRGMLEESGVHVSPRVLELTALEPLPAPTAPGVLDRTWQAVPLRAGNGFASLAARDTPLGELAHGWRLFFL